MQVRFHPKQSRAFRSRAREILYGGAAGGGKSYFLRVAAIAWCCAIPGLQVYLFRRTHPDLVKNHLTGRKSFPALLADLIQSKQARINWGEKIITFWNGSQIHLCHCQYEKDMWNYQGAEIDVLLIDELTHFTETIYRFLRSRLRATGLELPPEWAGRFPRIVNGANPGNIGHNWVKKAFIRPAPEGVVWQPPKSEGGLPRQFIKARMKDNPTLGEEDPGYEDRLEGLGTPELVRAMKDGDWDIVAGGMFDDLWSRDVHVIPRFEIPQSWHRDRSFDWGSSRPFGVLWWAESDGTTAPNGRTYPPGTIFLENEWYGCTGEANVGVKMLATEIADGIVELEEKWKVEILPGPADSSIYDTVNGVCIADQMSEHGCDWTRADKSPGSRKNGWELIRTLLKGSLRHPMEEPGLFVFDHCVNWIDTVPVLPRDQKKPDDVDTKAEDHLGDATRYRVLHPAPPPPHLSQSGGDREPFEAGW